MDEIEGGHCIFSQEDGNALLLSHRKKIDSDFLLGLPQVLLPGGQAAADVTLRFIKIQNFIDVSGQLQINLGKPFPQILMYGGFGNPKFFCGGSDCRMIVNGVMGNG
jgi:hypothetical protein